MALNEQKNISELLDAKQKLEFDIHKLLTDFLNAYKGIKLEVDMDFLNASRVGEPKEFLHIIIL